MNKIGIMLSIVTISALVIGCGSSSSAEQQEPTKIEATTQLNTTTTNLRTGGDGILSQDAVIKATTKDGKSDSTVTLPAGTSFTDKDGKKLENVVPKIEITQDKSSASTTTTATNKTQTTIKLTDANGNPIAPSEAVTVKVKAPSNAKPGEEVSVSIPDDADKADGQKKLVIFIVDAEGYISVKLFPNVFKKQTVILIIIEKTTPLTGGEGGTK